MEWSNHFPAILECGIIRGCTRLSEVLKRRTYESPGPTVRYGAKPYCVLAHHLLNHNMNGPGDNPLNVVPFWAAANTKRAQQFARSNHESFVKAVECPIFLDS